MSGDDKIHDQEIRNALGAEGVHAKAAQQEDSVLSKYYVVTYHAYLLPGAYVPVVFAKWLRSLHRGNDFFKLMKSNDFYPIYQKYIETVFKHSNTIVRLAILDDKDTVLGFSVSRGTILEYVYVDKDQRRQGIAKNLVPESIDTITHLTNMGLSIWGSKNRNWKFNPFA